MSGDRTFGRSPPCLAIRVERTRVGQLRLQFGIRHTLADGRLQVK